MSDIEEIGREIWETLKEQVAASKDKTKVKLLVTVSEQAFFRAVRKVASDRQEETTSIPRGV